MSSRISALVFIGSLSVAFFTVGCGKGAKLSGAKDDGIVFCTVDGARLRSAPGGSVVPADLHFASRLEVVDKKRQKAGKFEWIKVRSVDGLEGWIATSVIRDDVIAGILTDSAHLCVKADDLPDNGRRLRPLTVCLLEAEKNGRYAVTVGDKQRHEGWVFKDVFTCEPKEVECGWRLDRILSNKNHAAMISELRTVIDDSQWGGSRFMALIPVEVVAEINNAGVTEVGMDEEGSDEDGPADDTVQVEPPPPPGDMTGE